MFRIVFVDDEPRVLDGIRRMLGRQAAEWEVAFAYSGPEALAGMQAAPPDVVVTDMRMPGMDGATLLERVRDRHPDAVRVVLSGQADTDCALRAMSVAHQYLSKPCEPQTLVQMLRDALAAREALHEDKVRALVHEIGTLPATPGVYLELSRRLADPDCTIGDIESLVSRDTGLASQVLHMANSAYFGRSGQLSGIGAAVALVGTRSLRNLVLCSEVFRGFSGGTDPALLDSVALQRHSLRVAGLAQALVERPEWREAAFAAGLLHDVGVLLLASRLPGPTRLVNAESARSGRPRAEVERESLGVHHGQLGAYVFKLWGLPLDLVQAVLHHCDLPIAPDEPITVPRAVALAEELARDPVDFPPAAAARESRFASDPRWDAWTARVAAQPEAEAA